MSNAIAWRLTGMTEKELKTKWICCPMCDKEKRERESDDEEV